MVQSETAAAAAPEDWPSIPRAQLHSLPPGGQAGYGDILGSLDMYTFASQTQDFIGGLLGKMLSRSRLSISNIYIAFISNYSR